MTENGAGLRFLLWLTPVFVAVYVFVVVLLFVLAFDLVLVFFFVLVLVFVALGQDSLGVIVVGDGYDDAVASKSSGLSDRVGAPPPPRA